MWQGRCFDAHCLARQLVDPLAPVLSQHWRTELEALLADFPLPHIEDVDTLAEGWQRLWEPLLDRHMLRSARWDPSALSWNPPSPDVDAPEER